MQGLVPTPPRIVAIETVGHPLAYQPHQIRRAYDIAYQLNRGKFVLAEAPHDPR